MQNYFQSNYINITSGQNNIPALECMAFYYITYIITLLCTVIFHFNSDPFLISVTTLQFCAGIKLLNNIQLHFHAVKGQTSF